MDGAADVNQSGTFTTWTSYAANYTVSDTTSGRGIMILPPLVGGVPQSLNLVFYVVNAGKQFAMEVDPHSLQMEEEVLEGALEGAASYTWFRLRSLWWSR